MAAAVREALLTAPARYVAPPSRRRRGGAVFGTVIRLLLLEAFALFLVYMVAKYVFGLDLLDFTTPYGHLRALAVVALTVYVVYYGLFERGAAEVGAAALYDPDDARRATATSPIAPPSLL